MAFQKIILNNLVYNEKFCRKITPFLKTEWMPSQEEQIVFDHIKDFMSNYNATPTKEALAIMVGNSPLSEGLFESTMDVVQDIAPDNTNIDWLFDQTEEWAKERAVFLGLYKALDIAEGKDKNLDKNAIPTILSEALATSFDVNLGHSYFKNAEEHYDTIHDVENKKPFHMDVFNTITKNGVKKATLNIICAPINCGKSIWLVQQAAEWLVDGKNVLIISMEMDEASYRERIDCTILDKSFDEVFAMEKSLYLNNVSKIRSKTQGELFIKEYGSGTAHVGHFRHLIQELKIKEDFVPDVILIDYLTIMASAKLPASAKGNTNTYFGSVAEEVRAFGKEVGVPIWTALQLDRGTQGASDAGMGNIALAIAIAATADFMFVVLEPPEFMERGQVICKVIKNRYSSYKGTKFLIGKSGDKQKFYEIDNAIMDEDEDVSPVSNKQPQKALPTKNSSPEEFSNFLANEEKNFSSLNFD